MAKVVNPRYFYRLYTQRIDPQTLKPIGEKSPFFRCTCMRYVVEQWQYKVDNGFDHLEIHVERRTGHKWEEISTLWGSFLDPWYVLFQHEAGLELLEYHTRYCKKEDFE